MIKINHDNDTVHQLICWLIRMREINRFFSLDRWKDREMERDRMIRKNISQGFKPIDQYGE